MQFFKGISCAIEHIIATLKSERAMLLRICWLPFLLRCSFSLLLKYGFINHAVASLHWQAEPQSVSTTHMLVHILNLAVWALLVNIAIVGIYRYLLGDSRFHLSRLPLRKELPSGRSTLTLSFYWRIDSAVMLLMFFDIALQFLSEDMHHALAYSLANSDLAAGTAWGPRDALSLMALRYATMFASAQLCLAFPYIALSEAIKPSKIWQNLKALNGRRFSVFILHLIIVDFLLGVYGIVMRLAYWLTYRATILPAISLPVVSALLYTLSGFVTIICLVIFYENLFRACGVRDDATHDALP